MPRLPEPVFAPPVAGPSDRARDMMLTTTKAGHAAQPEDRAVTRPADDLFLTNTDILSVRNDGQERIVFAWARVEYPIGPGQTGWVPFPALCDKLGDPRSMVGQVVTYSDSQGNRGMVCERHVEISRLFGRYGIRNENLDDETAEPLPEERGRPVSLMGRAPKVYVETLSGHKVTFPTQRPDMVALPVADDGDRKVPADSRRMIDELREQSEQDRNEIRRLERLINSRLGIDSNGDSVDAEPLADVAGAF